MGASQSTLQLNNNTKAELLVSGWIRTRFRDKLNIPTAIEMILREMIRDVIRSDVWDPKWTHEDFTINNDTNVIEYSRKNISYRSSSHYKTAYTSKVIKSGVLYNAKIRIQNKGNGVGRMYVGIIPNDYHMYSEYYFVSSDYLSNVNYMPTGYLFNCVCNGLGHPDGRISVGQYLPQLAIPNGYTIEMIFDMTDNNASIACIVDNVDHGIIFDKVDKSKSYRFIVTFHGIGDSAEIELI